MWLFHFIGRAVLLLLAPFTNFRALRDGVGLLWRHRVLCREMVKRDLGAQFAGQALGSLWIVLHPLVLFGIYVFVFAVVLRARIDISEEMPRDYTTYILAGLAPWLATQQALSLAPTALTAQANLVKQVVFPIEVLPLSAIVAAAIPLLIGITMIAIRQLLLTGGLPLTVLLLPIALVIHCAFLLGIAMVLSAVTPFFRDIKDIVAALTVVGVYVVPAFYLPQWVPETLRPWLYANPFSYIIWMYPDVLYFGEFRHPWAWLIATVMGVASLALGMRTFRQVKSYVANVL